MIEKHIADMEFFQQPFIVLQGLYVDQLENLSKLQRKRNRYRYDSSNFRKIN